MAIIHQYEIGNKIINVRKRISLVRHLSIDNVDLQTDARHDDGHNILVDTAHTLLLLPYPPNDTVTVKNKHVNLIQKL